MDRDLVSDAEYQDYLDYLEEYEAEREEQRDLRHRQGRPSEQVRLPLRVRSAGVGRVLLSLFVSCNILHHLQLGAYLETDYLSS